MSTEPASASLRTTVIGIRHPDECASRPLPEAVLAFPVLPIPFYQLHSRFPALATDSNYLLYCEKGAMSRLHACYLQAAGYLDVGVFSGMSGVKKD